MSREVRTLRLVDADYTLSKPLYGWKVRENYHVDAWPLNAWEILKIAVAVFLWGLIGVLGMSL